MLKIQSYALPPVQTNAYLITDEVSRKAILVDAPMGVWNAIEPELRQSKLTLEACLLTHAHFDHVLGASELNKIGIPLYLHEDDREMLANLSAQLQLFGLPGDAADIQIDHWLKAPSTLELIGHKWELRHVPGHCPGNIAIYLSTESQCFVGDAIFAGSVGRTDLPGGDADLLAKSIREQIYSLPDATRLYPGHGPSTTVGREKVSNPFVRV